MSWMKSLREQTGLSQARLAELAGTSQPQIKRLENGEREMTKTWAERIAPHLGVTASELLFQEGEVERVPATENAAGNASGVLDYDPSVPGAMPELDVRAGAGDGMVGSPSVYALPAGGTYTGHSVLAEWLFPAAYLRQEVKARPGFTIVVEVQGESMRPTLEPGDRVIVDLSQSRFGPDGAIYLISDDDGDPQVKRLQKTEGDPRRVLVTSHNPMVRDRTIAADRLKVIGRVVGRVSKL